MSWLFAVVAMLVLAGTFLAVLGLLGDLPPVEPDLRPDELNGEPVFDVVLRGYRMDEVDERIGALEAELQQLRGDADPTAEPVEPVEDTAESSTELAETPVTETH